MRKGLFVVILMMVVGFVCGLSRAADLEVILGTSSAFNVVRGTSVSSGTSTLYVGSSTVSIGTTTQSAKLYIAGSSTSSSDASLSVVKSNGSPVLYIRNDGLVGLGTTTSMGNSEMLMLDNSGACAVTFNKGADTDVTDIAFGSARRFRWQMSYRATNENERFEIANYWLNNTGTWATSITNNYKARLAINRDGAVLIGTTTSYLNSSLYVGTSSSVTAGGLGTITAGFLSIGTITADVSLHGTNTVHIPNLYVSGNKSFLIPHPDPEKKGWLLQHCAVESPTRGDNLYRFKAVIQSDEGETAIPLPSYWPHLNENPDVLVSPVGQFARGYGYVDESSNKLIIRGEKKGVYTVVLIGTRKDSYARKFDEKGVEYIDNEVSELLIHATQKKIAEDIQLINARNNIGNKTFLDPVADTFGLAVCQ